LAFAPSSLILANNFLPLNEALGKEILTMLDCLYQFVKDFQTIIVGLLGFSGVIYTLRMNAQLSQKQHERSVKHDREVLRTALRAELELIRKSFSDKASSIEENNEESDAFYPSESHTSIYQNFVGKLGLLSAEEVSSVIEAYTLIFEAPTRLRLLSSGHDPSYDKPGYIFIKAKHCKTATGIYKSFLPSIEAALQKLRDT
jgi:hypothetical protein